MMAIHEYQEFSLCIDETHKQYPKQRLATKLSLD